MIRDNFDVAVATDICRLANEYSYDYINTHPNAYGSAEARTVRRKDEEALI